MSSEPRILGRGRAPGKVILFGEHAVVYGRPALAVPVTQVQAEATIEAAPPGAGLTIDAADLGETIALRDAPADHPLAAAVRLALATFNPQSPIPNPQSLPDLRITIRSTIPIASGLGSGAAVATAIVRGVGDWGLGIRDSQSPIPNPQSLIPNTQSPLHALSPATIAALVYEVERLHHGTPSGIDNTVIAYGQPVYFVRGQAPEPFEIGRSFTLVIGDTGIRSPTRIAVGDVRRAWERETPRFEALFDRVAAIVEAARTAIAAGEPARLGPLMDENHALLQEIGVSCPELDALVAAARAAGALGAKLSGGGRGGNMIALAPDEMAQPVADALVAAGAARVIVTRVGGK